MPGPLCGADEGSLTFLATTTTPGELVEDEALNRLVIGQSASVRQAMEAIDRGAAEIALMVDQDGRLIGTVSDGDIRRALLAGATLDDAVRPCVTTAPKTATPASSRAEILDEMRARSISQIPVVSGDGRLLGLHVMRDLLGGQQRPNAAVIMAGGKGTRLGPLTEILPKPMLRVAGRPILERLVLHLVGSGIKRIRLSVNYLSHTIEDHFGDGKEFGCDIRYLREDPDRPLGTVGSLSLISPDDEALTAPLLLMNGDLVTDFSVAELLASHEKSGALATLALSQYDHRVPFGVARVDEGDLVELVEKPVESWPVNAGIYVIEQTLLTRIPQHTEYHVTDLLADCLTRGDRINAWQLTTDWQDVGRPSELKQARGEL